MFSQKLGKKLDKYHLLKHPFIRYIGMKENLTGK